MDLREPETKMTVVRPDHLGLAAAPLPDLEEVVPHHRSVVALRPDQQVEV